MSSDIFGVAKEDPIVTGKQHYSGSSSSINLFDEAPLPTHVRAEVTRRDPNWSSVDAEPHSNKLSRPYSGKTNQSSISFGQSDEALPVYVPKKRMMASTESVGFSLGIGGGNLGGDVYEVPKVTTGRGGRRDPNARSVETVGRPSSRVLAQPGGKSSFSFA